MRVPVADIAPQQIGAAGDVEPQFLAAPQPRRGGVKLNDRMTGSSGVSGSRTPVSMAISQAVLRVGSIRRRAGLMTPIDRR